MGYANRQEFVDKANWEGGLDDYFFGYGCRLEDLPADDPELRERVADALTAVSAYEEARGALEDLLGDLLE